METEKIPLKFGTILPEVSIKACMIKCGYNPNISEDEITIDAFLKQLLERLKAYAHHYRVEYVFDHVEDVVLYRAYIDKVEYGFNIVLFDSGDAPLMICINFDGKIFGECLGWINMEPDE